MSERLPAPGLPGPRAALVIATSDYQDSSLARLRSPAQDAAGLAEVLADPRIGAFGVTVLNDPTAHQLRLGIEDFLDGRKPDDLLLLYLSCHGVLDRRGRLYFTAADTVKTRLAATGIEPGWLLDLMDDCRARRQVLILDCCFSGAFAHGAKSGHGLNLEQRLAGPGRGRAILTASRAGEYSFEGDPLPGSASVAPSVFTAGLIDGLRTGAADTDHDGRISIEDAYDHAYAHVQARGSQTPQRWLYGAEGRIWLARNPTGVPVVPAPLPAPLQTALDSPLPHIRTGAVHTLAEWLVSGDPARAMTARQELQHVADHDNPRVAKAARESLASAPPSPDPDPEPELDPVTEAAAEAAMEEARTLAESADAHRLADRYDAAVADFDRAIALDPTYDWAIARRGEALRMAKRYEAAMADLDRAIELDPDNDFALASRGATHRLVGRYEEAVADSDRAIAIDPSYAWALASRGEAHRLAGRHDQAVADLDRALELDSRQEFAFSSRGEAHRAAERYDKALADFDRAIELDATSDWAMARRGDVYRMLERYDASLADLGRAIELNPENDFAFAARGETHRVAERYDQARKDFDRAIELNATYGWAIARRGDCHRLSGRYRLALPDFDRAIELDATSDWAIARRGEAYRMLERYEEALADFDRAIELNPENDFALASRGESHRIAGRFDQALRDLDRAIELSPSYTWAIARRKDIPRSVRRKR